MSLPNSRITLIEWALRELGAPVLEINIDEEQIEQRVDECLAYFRDYHFDGVEHVFHPHKLTASVANFAAIPSVPLQNGETLTGQTSGAIATLYDVAQDQLSARITFPALTAIKFTDGEVLVGSVSGGTVTLTPTNSVIIGDLDNEYITLPENIISIFNLVSFDTSPATSSGMFDVRYQFALNDMYNLLQTDIISYEMFKYNIALYQFLLNGEKQIHYNRITEKLYLDTDWKRNLKPDMYLIVEGWGAVDPEAYTKVYSNLFVRKYCTALLKKQWGTNLKKFSGIALPGRVTMNGQQVYDEGDQEVKELEKRIDKEWQLPPTMMVG